MCLATASRLLAATLALLTASFPTLLAAPGAPSQAPPARPALAVVRLTPRRVLASAVRPAQPVVLSGSVRDTNGRPLPGATVCVAGSS